MIRANLIAERVAIEAYSQMIALIGDKDSTTRRILEAILSQEQEHADELSDWLDLSVQACSGGPDRTVNPQNSTQPLRRTP